MGAQSVYVGGQLDADAAAPPGLGDGPAQHGSANAAGAALRMNVHRFHLRDEAPPMAQLTYERELKCTNYAALELRDVDAIIWVTLDGVKRITVTPVQGLACRLEWDV
jgi:hypothetical protein